jgi:ABC-type Na+ efflux pump permease subunit
MVGLVVFVCFHLRHAFEQKEMDVLLSRPLSRPQIMLAYWLGFSAVAFLLVLTAVMLLSFLPLPNPTGFAVWGVSLLLESWLVVALAMFAAFTLQSAVSAVLAALGFYVLGRMMAFFLLVVKSKLAIGSLWVSQIVKGLLAGISLVMPRLDLFSQSDWLIYGITHSQELMLAGIQALVFIPLLLAASTLDFLRKEF